MNFFALVTARRNSKGILRKNISPILGKELIRYTFEFLADLDCFKKSIVSTDDEIILQLVKEYPALEAPFKRPSELALDDTRSIDVALHALDFYKTEIKDSDYLALFQPTTPIRSAKHVQEAIEILSGQAENFDSLVSICPYKGLHPFKYQKIENGYLAPFFAGADCESPRDLLPKMYQMNGSLFITKVSVLKEKKSFFNKTYPYVMTHPRYSLDIDRPEDLVLMEYWLKQGINNED
jgi:CMP-N-acetylneuraminic acid synthetase